MRQLFLKMRNARCCVIIAGAVVRYGVRAGRLVMLMVESAREPMDAIERDKILNARAMSPERKLRAGLELFELNRALILAALKSQHPHADAAALNALFLQRLAQIRQLEAGQ